MSLAYALLLVAIGANPARLAAISPLSLPSPTVEGTAADTIVVCPGTFRAALEPWLQYRRQQGRRIAVVSNLGSPDDIRGRIREAASGGRLRFVLLVGAADYNMVYDSAIRERCVPMHYAKARVNVLWGSTPTISTDNWYVQGESATDEMPTPALAIGRIPAESPDELQDIVTKIMAYERSTDFGPWRQRMNFVAGTGNFGILADTILESAAQYFLTNSIPAEYRVSMTQGNWQSPYCPDPRRLHQTAIDRLNEGALFWVYIGHGYHRGLARMEVPGGEYPILEIADAEALRCHQGRPIALFLSCFAGAIDARERCLASALLRSPGGPVAVSAGTRVTMPYAMTVMATCMTDEVFATKTETLGEALLHSKQKMLEEASTTDRRRALLDSIASAVSPAAHQLAAERAEHVLMFNLIGDPLLQLRHPKSLRIDAPAKATAGTTLDVAGNCTVDGPGRLELVLRRDLVRDPPPQRGAYPRTAEALAQFQDAYYRANDRCLQAVSLQVRDGRFHAQIDLPASARGMCHFSLLVSGQDDFALGATDVEIVKRP